ncbi:MULTISPECIES: aminodeoxychorismate synthase component I [unclassified Polaromonas]|uniref:aminodeoxychorismate synthase component I n=1 Tax=unclassified Polaromonas TaxID=2638319 RepID=UPI000F079232|nr:MULTISPECIES: aminodeoxychorismate synthase component I [unclassified Polaromonas]AYQ28477.1 aminodeoxychorismate synthase component I [Polaromonas sp. SP1]QGJ20404.1 aminodeoxychorismate synthase component I [Polaromonas sp. Pch-P]
MTDTVSALIDFTDPHQPEGPRLRHAFGAPREVLVAHRLEDVRAVLDAVQAAAQQGAWCVGYLRYEAAPAFDAALTVHAADGALAWFAVHDKPLPWPQPLQETSPQVHWQDFLPRPAFDTALAELQRAIDNGEYYQANFTAQMKGVLAGDAGSAAALSLFHALQRAQPGGYAAFLDAGDEQLLSVSPELFFDWRDGLLLARPMKGTAPRGANPQDDAAQAEALRNSAKERAENVMVVDLLRNDLSRIAEPFSVRVPRLFHTEALPAVWQMTSDVEARTRAGCSLAGVFAALFPCGSITGAPKVNAMRAIRALEHEPRGVYCGAIGVVRPGGAATFNVPIRTVTLRGNAARCGIGSGITSGATADGEWREWTLKQAFVQRASAPFELLETLGLAEGELRDADAHLARMSQAAQHFAYPWNMQHVEGALQSVADAHAQGTWRVRLLLDAAGRARAEAYALPASPARVRLQLAQRPLDEAHGEFVRCKTTRRAHYDAFTPTDPEVFDTLLWNADGELTECTRGNVAFLLDGRWVTPPLRCGLLAGVGRARALQDGRIHEEAVVRVEDLPRVEALAFVNSLRGWIPAGLAVMPQAA